MAKRKKSVGLIAFLKGNSDPAVGMPGCANYDHHYGGCLFADTCQVEQGQRCGYFERSVLPTAEDIGLTEQAYSMYEAAVGLDIELQRPQARLCPDCGAGLKPHRRYCDDCTAERRRQSYRRLRDAKRLKRNS